MAPATKPQRKRVMPPPQSLPGCLGRAGESGVVEAGVGYVFDQPVADQSGQFARDLDSEISYPQSSGLLGVGADGRA